MNCKSCGQPDTVVTFKPRNDGYVRNVCSECAADNQRARRAGNAKPASVTPAPAVQQMEHKLLSSDRKELELLRKKVELFSQVHPTAPAVLEPAAKLSGEAIAVMIASDWHIEEPVDKAKVHGLNEYNLEIAKKRAHNFFRNGLRLTNIFADSSKIDTIYLGFLGDFISNYLHEVLREINLLGPAEAINFALQLLNDGITFLLANSSYKLIIDCIPGNHGRMTKEIRSSNATETSIETFMYQSLARLYVGNERVSFRVASSKMLYRQFFNYKIRVLHGDDIAFGGGIGGITIPIRKKIAAWDKAIKADLTIMGHFHQLLDGGDFLVNGSLIGYNEYAQSIGASPEEARQCFFVLHSRNGGCKSVVAPIWLD